MILYFQNSQGKEREIGQPNTYSEVWDIINEFLDERNFKSDYSRTWKENDRYWFDVGSHTEFFILDGECPELLDILN